MRAGGAGGGSCSGCASSGAGSPTPASGLAASSSVCCGVLRAIKASMP
jgi:hypothetical protein